MKNIIFDIGGVLIKWDPDVVYKKYFANDLSQVKHFYNETGIWEANTEMDRGRSIQEILAGLSNKFSHYHEPIHLWQTKWLDMVIGPIEDSVKILKSLYTQGYPLYILTNFSAETFFTYMRYKYDFFCCFKDIVVSGVEKVIKPNPQIYKILLQRNKLNPKDCIFIDDVVKNLLTAENLGMATIEFKTPKKLISELKILGITVTIH